MRKVKLQVQVSADFYMGGPNGEMDWMHFPWSDDFSAYTQHLTDSVDTIILGRNLAEGFIPAWASGPPEETQESIDFMNNTPKVVISKSLTESPWENATVAADLVPTVNELKARDGKDIIVYGGSTLVQDMIANGLIDDLYLFVNPTAIGSGLPVFPKTGGNRPLTRVEAVPFECGVTAFHYQPKQA
ncbi:dihydrofolate reductase family protein [Actinomadura adrarensis]|uniref:Dihydrofolate reductase family protein n=1 Tax=Actinomadura adrarensis TaxID=1819600 RepID=A0ABW3CKZ7_9ACTN